MTTAEVLCTASAVAFILFFPVPFFARRFGKFLPADAGTALVRSFHIPRQAKSQSPERIKRRRQLWKKLFAAGLFWGIVGILGLFLLIFSNYPLTLVVLLWLCSLMACIDEKLHVLPDVLTIPLLICGFYFATLDLGIVTPLDSASGALAGFLLPTVTAAVMTPFFPRSLGGGDFKMLTALGAWLGFPGLIAVILSSVIFFALIALIRRQKEGPYGTSLFLGVLTVLILQQFDCLRFLFVVV